MFDDDQEVIVLFWGGQRDCPVCRQSFENFAHIHNHFHRIKTPNLKFATYDETLPFSEVRKLKDIQEDEVEFLPFIYYFGKGEIQNAELDQIFKKETGEKIYDVSEIDNFMGFALEARAGNIKIMTFGGKP